jgi:foldase protein PrsA
VLGACLLLAVLLVGCSSKPVAFVNGQKITQEQFTEQLEAMAGGQVLEDMINRRLLEEEAQRLGLTPTDAQVDAEIARSKQAFGDEAYFLAALRASGHTIEDLRREVSQNLLQTALCTKDVKVAEPDLRKFYEARQEQYDKPERVTIQEITALSKAQADEVYKLASKEGQDFDALARQYNVAGRPEWQATGGRSQPLPREQLFPVELRGPVFALKKGEVCQPLRMGGRWDVIKMLDRLPAEKSTFEANREQVERDYKLRQARPLRDVLSELRSKANVQVIPDRYARVGEAFRGLSQMPQFGGEGRQPGAGAPGAGGTPPAPGTGRPAGAPGPAAQPTQPAKPPQGQ